MSEGFRIPVARSEDGRVVRPEDARKGATHRCPRCEALVDLHAGEKKRRHFHHRAAACSAEGAVHLAAKLLVAQAVDDFVQGGPAPEIVRRCAAEGCDALCRQALPRKVRAAALEHRLPSGRVVDVALLASAERGALPLPVAAVEIVHTHALDEEKARAMAVPWLEVDAAQICADAGLVLVAARDRLVPWLCAEHAGTRGRPERRAREERRRLSELVRRLPYRLADFPGFRAQAIARCPRGHEAIVFAWDGREPPWPRPPHVVAMQSDLDWSFHAGRAAKVLPWRRTFTSACATCGERLPR